MSTTETETVSTNENKKVDLVLPSRPTLLKWVFAVLLVIASIVLLIMYMFGDKIMSFIRRFTGGKKDAPASDTTLKPEDVKAVRGEAEIPKNLKDLYINETPLTLISLASELKEMGIKLHGVTDCRYTAYQRTLFGERKSPSRDILESIYVECRGPQNCPNVRVFPTWYHSETDVKEEGLVAPEILRRMMERVKQARLAPKPEPTPAPKEVEKTPIIVDVTDKPELERQLNEQNSEDEPPPLSPVKPSNPEEHVEGIENMADMMKNKLRENSKKLLEINPVVEETKPAAEPVTEASV